MLSVNVEIKEFSGVCPVGQDTVKLAETASSFSKGSVLDMGTGTGYIGIYLAKCGFDAEAVDLNKKAVENAKFNAERNGVNLPIYLSNLFEGVSRRFDLIIFNPPRNPNEGNIGRWIGGFVRKNQTLVRMILPLVQKLSGKAREKFILSYVHEAKKFLNPEGKLLLHLEPHERDFLQEEFPNMDLQVISSPEAATNGQIVVCHFTHGK